MIAILESVGIQKKLDAHLDGVVAEGLNTRKDVPLKLFVGRYPFIGARDANCEVVSRDRAFVMTHRVLRRFSTHPQDW